MGLGTSSAARGPQLIRCDMAAAAQSIGAFGPVRFPVFPPSWGFAPAASPASGLTGSGPVLSHVHGFQAAAQPPAVFISDRRVAFAAGKLVVELSLDSRRQRFAHGHTAAVTCLAYCEQSGLGASGQVVGPGAKSAEALIWDSETMQVCASLSFHQAAVEAMAFVQEGEVLVTIGADRDRTMALWAAAREGWFRMGRKDKAPLAVISAYKGGAVLGILSSPGGSTLTPHFATYGVQHVKFWQSDRLAPAVEGRRGAFGAEGPPKAVVSAAWASKDRFVAGGSNGEVFFFEGTVAVRRIQLQSFAVALLLPLRDCLLVAYAHGVISLLHNTNCVDVEVSSLPGSPDIKGQSAIVGGAAWRQQRLLLASKTSLLALDLQGPDHKMQASALLATQPESLLTAVCCHPAEPRLYTGALDGLVRCYRSDTHRPIPERSLRASAGVTCLAISGGEPGREASAWMAVGCEDSTITVMSETTFHYVLRRNLSARKARLVCARFSTVDQTGAQPLWLAVGAEDGCIHTFKFKEPFCTSSIHTGAEIVNKVATLRGHAAPIVDVAFASGLPCSHLMSVDVSGQALAFDVPMARRLASLGQVRDLTFSPWTSPIGWQVLGCWTPAKAVEGAALPSRRFQELPGRSLVAVSDAISPAVELFSFPCPKVTVPSVRLEGPATAITALEVCGLEGSILAASDTVLFTWSWPRPAIEASKPEPAVLASPLRPARGQVIFDTPTGSKRAMSVAGGGDLTPQQVSKPPSRLQGSVTTSHTSPAKVPSSSVRSASTPPKAGSRQKESWREELSKEADSPPTPAESLPDSGRASSKVAEAFPEVAPLPVRQESRKPSSSAPESSSLAGARLVDSVTSALGEVPENLWAIRVPAVEDAAAPRARGQGPISAKIGSSSMLQARTQTEQIWEDTEARARTIHERQQLDSVRLLIGGQAKQRVITIEVPTVAFQEARAGRFAYRFHHEKERFELEVHLPGGRLTRVMRNPLRRSLTFEGKAQTGAAGGGRERDIDEERLVFRLPAGFDLNVAPNVERHFEQGRCLVTVARAGGDAAIGLAAVVPEVQAPAAGAVFQDWEI